MSNRLTALDQALLVGDHEKAAALMVTRLRYVATSIQTAHLWDLRPALAQALAECGITDLSDRDRARAEVLATWGRTGRR